MSGVISGPTISPTIAIHNVGDEHDPSLNNLHQGPLYPTMDGKPPKSSPSNKEGLFKKPKPATDKYQHQHHQHHPATVNADHDHVDEDDDDSDDADENDESDGGDIDDHQHRPQQPQQQQPTQQQQPQHPHQQHTHHSNKFDFINYDEDEDAVGPPAGHPNGAHGVGPGPGFFNPAASKTQYNDFDDTYGHNLNVASPPSGAGKPFNPYQQQQPPQHVPNDKIPPELFNIPNVQIEQLLQHIQGGGGPIEQAGGSGGNGGHLPPFGSQANGINGGFPFGEHGGDGGRPVLQQPGFAYHFHSLLNYGWFIWVNVGEGFLGVFIKV